MRQIKFRGKNSKNEWVYGSLIINETENEKGKFQVAFIVPGLPCASDGCDFYTARMERVKIETIWQYTGLHDNKGNEIYEGDIIYSEFSDGSHCNSLVGWNEDEVCFGLMEEYAYRSLQEGFDFPRYKNHVLLSFRKDAIRFEVIGNLYDNPELIRKR